MNYFPDYPRWIAIAADAKHHWPIEDPSVAGEPLPYHYFVYVHMAAASQVTGLDLPLVFLRLFILPLAVLLVLELVVAGRSCAQRLCGADRRLPGLLHRRAAAGPGADLPGSDTLRAVLHLSVSEPELPLGHGGVRATDHLARRAVDSSRKLEVGDWLLVIIFMVGASDAKITILPLVLGALVLYAGSRWILERRVGSPSLSPSA